MRVTSEGEGEYVVPSSTVRSVRKGLSLCLGGQKAYPMIYRDCANCAVSVRSLDRGAGMRVSGERGYGAFEGCVHGPQGPKLVFMGSAPVMCHGYAYGMP